VRSMRLSQIVVGQNERMRRLDKRVVCVEKGA